MDPSARQLQAEAAFERLFGRRDSDAPEDDPELGEILRRFTFGDVFSAGELSDQMRELVTVTVLACLRLCLSDLADLPQPYDEALPLLDRVLLRRFLHAGRAVAGRA